MARNPKSDARKFLKTQRGAPLSFGALMMGSVRDLMGSVREGNERTLEDMAQSLGVSRAYLCDVEQGRRVNVERAASWAEALGYPPALFVQLALQDEVDAAGRRGGLRVGCGVYLARWRDRCHGLHALRAFPFRALVDELVARQAGGGVAAAHGEQQGHQGQRVPAHLALTAPTRVPGRSRARNTGLSTGRDSA